MPRTSILRLSDADLDSKFGKEVKEREIILNASHYKDEVSKLVSGVPDGEMRNFEKIIYKLKEYPPLHRGKVLSAFGYEKVAEEVYKSIEKGAESYDEAQYKLLQLALGKEETDLKAMVTCANNLEPSSRFHGICCLLVGDELRNKGDKQGALEWYLKVEEDPEDTNNNSYEMAIESISKLSEKIEEVSLGGGKLVFKKGKIYKLSELHLQDIEHISNYWDSYRSDGQPGSYVISLSQNENGMQEGKFNFLCTPHSAIDDGTSDGIFVEMEDLGVLIQPKRVRFKGINSSGELLFQQVNNRNKNGKFSIDYTFANNQGIRTKGDRISTGNEASVLAWEDGDNTVYMVRHTGEAE